MQVSASKQRFFEKKARKKLQPPETVGRAERTESPTPAREAPS
jgi:hypothetical protein